MKASERWKPQEMSWDYHNGILRLLLFLFAVILWGFWARGNYWESKVNDLHLTCTDLRSLGVEGAIDVSQGDPHGWDGDGDGVGCEP